MWSPNPTLTAPAAIYALCRFPQVASSNLWISIASAGAAQAEAEGTFTIEGPSLPITRADFAPVTAAALMGYQDLSENWDGEGARAPSSTAIASALRMLAATPTILEAPKPMVIASGEVALYWDYGDTYAEIGFEENGKYYAYAESPGFEPVHLDDVYVEDEAGLTVFPMDILEILTIQSPRAAA
jgi:hypothetical protein